MKNNKKVIAMVLALIMILVPTVSAFASLINDYTNIQIGTDGSVTGTVYSSTYLDTTSDSVYLKVYHGATKLATLEKTIRNGVSNVVYAGAKSVSGDTYYVYNFSGLSFTLDNGTVSYTVYASAYDNHGNLINYVTFTDISVTKPSSGGTVDNGGTIGGGAIGGGNSPVVDSTTGAAKLTTSTPTLDADKNAKVTVSKSDLDAAVSAAKADANGVKTVILEVPEVAGAKAYVPELPKEFLSAAAATTIIEIKTKLGTVDVPSNMLTAADVAGATNVGIKIATADATNVKDKDALANIGTRPVIDLSLQVDGKAKAWSNANAAITVKVPYTPTAAELANAEHLTVVYINDSGVVSAVPTGKYDAATGTVVFKTTHFSKYAVAYVNKTFSDITKSFAKSKIEVIASKGITSGTTATTYSPKANITRGQFIIFLVNALGLSASFDSNFADVAVSDYCYQAAGVAKKFGITTGVGANKFNPNATISRQDMMVMAYQAMKVAKKGLADGTVSDLTKYADSSKIASYAKTAMATCTKAGIVGGNANGTVNPTGKTTREEMAVIIYNIYNK